MAPRKNLSLCWHWGLEPQHLSAHCPSPQRHRLRQNTQEGAAGVIADLEAQGYNVVINWLTGYDTKPLTRCRVTQINNPGNVAPTPIR